MLQSSATPPYESTRLAGLIETALLMLLVVVELAFVAALWQNVQYAMQIQNGTFTGTVSDVNNSDSLVSGLALLGLACLLLAAVGYLTWAYRAYRNLAALGALQLRRTPKWIILGSIIPIMDLVVPYQLMRETWVGSDPDTKQTSLSERASAKTWWVLKLWWIFWLGGNFVSLIGSAMNTPNSLAGLISARQWQDLGELILTAAAVLLIFVIRSVDKRQSAKVARLIEASEVTLPSSS
jgi:hypothetical protein